jgi:hypothetical protein
VAAFFSAVISISLSAFNFRPPAALDIGLTLAVHATNPNVVPVSYVPSTVSILYGGAHLGTTRIDAGEQHATSCRLLHLLARLDGVELAQRAHALLSDVAHCHMELDAENSNNFSKRGPKFWYLLYIKHGASECFL